MMWRWSRFSPSTIVSGSTNCTTTALDGCEWSVSGSGRFTLKRKPPVPTGGPQNRSGRFGVETILLPLPGIEYQPFCP
jgi:hypothetical protein